MLTRIPAVIDLLRCVDPENPGSKYGIALCSIGRGNAVLGPPRKTVSARCGSDLEWPLLGPPEMLAKMESMIDLFPVTFYVCRHQIIGD